MENNLVVQENREMARAEIEGQQAFMQKLAESLWRDLKPIPFKEFVGSLLSDIQHMGELLEGFTDDAEPPWKRNIYYSYPQGGKVVHGGTTLLAETLIRKLKLVISLTMEPVVLDGDKMYKITAQGYNPTDKILVPPTEFYESAVMPAWCLKTKNKSGPYSPEQLAENKARGRKIIMNKARSKARRDMAFLLTGRDIPNLVAQIAYASEIKGSGQAIEKSRTVCVNAFADAGIPESRLIAHIGAPKELWTPIHIANLRGFYSRIKDAQDNDDSLEQVLVFGSDLDESPQVEIASPTAQPSQTGETPKRTADIDNVAIGGDEKPARKPRTKQCRVCKDKFHKDDVVTIEDGLYVCHNCDGKEEEPTKFKCDNCTLEVDSVTAVKGKGNLCGECINNM